MFFNQELQGTVTWKLLGDFNIDNALMAIAAARHAGVPSHIACEALGEFINTKRRQELVGEVGGIKVYDDFAHHPTAISKNLAGFRAKVGSERILAVLEPRSNTMKSGVHKDTLAKSLDDADIVYLYQDENVKWSVSDLLNDTKAPTFCADDIDKLVSLVCENAKPNDHIVVMSNGGFGSFHTKLIAALESK